MTILDVVRERWSVDEPTYRQLAEHVKQCLETEIRRQSLSCFLEARAKETHSILKKALRKAYTDYDQITDKAGVRIVAAEYSSLPVLEKLILDNFDVRKHENKTLGLAPEKLDYLGVHFDVVPRDDRPLPCPDNLRGRLCEIQIHTRAQSAWAAISHDFLYKGQQQLPKEIQRKVLRLVSLVEIFDEAVTEARKEASTLPYFWERTLLSALERSYWPLCGKPFDEKLSLEMIAALRSAYEESEVNAVAERVQRFVERHVGKLQSLFTDYRNDDRHLLLFQPESLLVFERLDEAPMRLRDVWTTTLPVSLLDPFEDIWGRTI